MDDEYPTFGFTSPLIPPEDLDVETKQRPAESDNDNDDNVGVTSDSPGKTREPSPVNHEGPHLNPPIPMPPPMTHPPFQYQPPQPPTVHHREPYKFIPYKYIVSDTSGVLKVCARSTDGAKSRIFSHKMDHWSYIDIPHGLSNVPETIQHLRAEMATESVTFDKRSDSFVVAPSTAITDRVESIATKPITLVPLTSSTALGRLENKFFDPFDETGEISEDALEVPPPAGLPAMLSKTFCSGNVNFAAFKTLVWCSVDESTIAFSFYNSSHNDAGQFRHPSIRIWTTVGAFGDKAAVRAAVVALAERAGGGCPEIQISVETFESFGDLTLSFTDLIEKEADICVHYGEPSGTDGVGIKILKACGVNGSDDLRGQSASPSHGTVEFVDLRRYVSKLYSYMASHDIYDLVKRIDITDGGTDQQTAACVESILDGTQVVGWQLPASSETSTTENVAFFVEKITVKCFLISKLYIVLSRCLFEVAQVSGCNISDVYVPGVVARGVVSRVNQVASCAQFVDKLPPDFIPAGMFQLTNVVPMADNLIRNMTESDDALTREVGQIVEPLRDHGWIVRDVYSLRSLSPLSLMEMPGVYGYFNDMIYSTEDIPGSTPLCQWSSIINLGIGWIGITVQSSSPETVAYDSDISFGYFGMGDACNHPFQAMKSAIEVYLTTFIGSPSVLPNPRMISKTVDLTTGSMCVKMRVTSANVDVYRGLILPKVAKEIESGNSEIVINLWHCNDKDTFTTNAHKADKTVYRQIIEATLVGTLENLIKRATSLFAPPPPPPPLPVLASSHPPPNQQSSSCQLNLTPVPASRAKRHEEESSVTPPRVRTLPIRRSNPPPLSPVTAAAAVNRASSIMRHSGFIPPPLPASCDVEVREHSSPTMVAIRPRGNTESMFK